MVSSPIQTMKPFRVSLTGFNTSEIKPMILEMTNRGFTYEGSLKANTTVLIAKHTGTNKWTAALEAGIPVVSYMWLKASTAEQPLEFIKYKMKPLSGLRISASGLSVSLKEEIENTCNEFGATYSSQLHNYVSLLLVPNDSKPESEKSLYARKVGIPIIKVEWFNIVIANANNDKPPPDWRRYSVFPNDSSAALEPTVRRGYSLIHKQQYSSIQSSVSNLFNGITIDVPSCPCVSESIVKLIHQNGGQTIRTHYRLSHSSHHSNQCLNNSIHHPVSEKWIKLSVQKGKLLTDEEITSSQISSSDSKIGIFSPTALRIFIAPAKSSTGIAMRSTISHLITRLGGTIMSVFNDKCTHIVVSDSVTDSDLLMRCSPSQVVVSSDWITESYYRFGVFIDTTNFIIKRPVINNTPNQESNIIAVSRISEKRKKSDDDFDSVTPPQNLRRKKSTPNSDKSFGDVTPPQVSQQDNKTVDEDTKKELAPLKQVDTHPNNITEKVFIKPEAEVTELISKQKETTTNCDEQPIIECEQPIIQIDQPSISVSRINNECDPQQLISINQSLHEEPSIVAAAVSRMEEALTDSVKRIKPEPIQPQPCSSINAAFSRLEEAMSFSSGNPKQLSSSSSKRIRPTRRDLGIVPEPLLSGMSGVEAARVDQTPPPPPLEEIQDKNNNNNHSNGVLLPPSIEESQVVRHDLIGEHNWGKIDLSPPSKHHSIPRSDSIKSTKSTKVIYLSSRLISADLLKGISGVVSSTVAETATHIICSKPCKSVYYLGGVAAGKWVLLPKFAEDLSSAGKWIEESEYEWQAGKMSEIENLSTHTHDLIKAASYWRKRGGGAYSAWRVAVNSDPKTATHYETILRCGSATVCSLTATPPPTHIIYGDSTKLSVIESSMKSLPSIYHLKADILWLKLINPDINLSNPSSSALVAAKAREAKSRSNRKK